MKAFQMTAKQLCSLPKALRISPKAGEQERHIISLMRMNSRKYSSYRSPGKSLKYTRRIILRENSQASKELNNRGTEKQKRYYLSADYSNVTAHERKSLCCSVPQLFKFFNFICESVARLLTFNL